MGVVAMEILAVGRVTTEKMASKMRLWKIAMYLNGLGKIV